MCKSDRGEWSNSQWVRVVSLTIVDLKYNLNLTRHRCVEDSVLALTGHGGGNWWVQHWLNWVFTTYEELGPQLCFCLKMTWRSAKQKWHAHLECKLKVFTRSHTKSIQRHKFVQMNQKCKSQPIQEYSNSVEKYACCRVLQSAVWWGQGGAEGYSCCTASESHPGLKERAGSTAGGLCSRSPIGYCSFPNLGSQYEDSSF